MSPNIIVAVQSQLAINPLTPLPSPSGVGKSQKNMKSIIVHYQLTEAPLSSNQWLLANSPQFKH